jgi:hypothetical protein
VPLASLVVDAHIPTRDLTMATRSIAADNRTSPSKTRTRPRVASAISVSTLPGVQLPVTGDLNFLASPRLLL